MERDVVVKRRLHQRTTFGIPRRLRALRQRDKSCHCVGLYFSYSLAVIVPIMC